MSSQRFSRADWWPWSHKSRYDPIILGLRVSSSKPVQLAGAFRLLSIRHALSQKGQPLNHRGRQNKINAFPAGRASGSRKAGQQTRDALTEVSEELCGEKLATGIWLNSSPNPLDRLPKAL